jgi:hypothetical protein
VVEQSNGVGAQRIGVRRSFVYFFLPDANFGE